MADMPQVLATYDALVGVALGAGLTYGFGALNRRHREAREDRTRWYQARFEAYSAVPEVLTKGVAIATRGPELEDVNAFLVDMTGTMGACGLWARMSCLMSPPSSPSWARSWRPPAARAVESGGTTPSGARPNRQRVRGCYIVTKSD